jgi:hypothetical protein
LGCGRLSVGGEVTTFGVWQSRRNLARSLHKENKAVEDARNAQRLNASRQAPRAHQTPEEMRRVADEQCGPPTPGGHQLHCL